MAKINQKAISAAIAARNAKSKSAGKCPHCVNGKIGNATCGSCKGKG